MAARRLLIVMLILLGLSTLAAALVPPRTTDDDGTTETSTEATASIPTNTTPSGLYSPGVVVVKKGVAVLFANAGDQIELAVCSDEPDQVEVPSFGLVDTVARNKPALFDLLFEEEGTYGVQLVDADRVVARFKVGPPKPGSELATTDTDRLPQPERSCARQAGFRTKPPAPAEPGQP